MGRVGYVWSRGRDFPGLQSAAAPALVWSSTSWKSSNEVAQMEKEAAWPARTNTCSSVS